MTRWTHDHSRWLIGLYLLLIPATTFYGYHGIINERATRAHSDCRQLQYTARLLNVERIGQIRLWSQPLKHADQSDPEVIAFKQTLQTYYGTAIPTPRC